MSQIQASGRSGSLVKQSQGHFSFVPAPLPPTPPLRYAEETVGLLADAERAMGRLDGTTASLPNPDLFVFAYVRKEAVLSSQIEGTQSSLSDVFEAEAAIQNPDHPRDVEEVSNYVGALNFGLSEMSHRKLSAGLLIDLHRRLMEGQFGSGQEPGRIRTVQNWIGKKGCDIDNAVYVPPPPGDVMRCLEELEAFLHSQDDMPPLVKIGLAHAQFESIHPFLDGNGRVGRLMVSLLLKEFRIMGHPLLYLSAYFKQNRSEYYAKLQNTREKGDWESWLQFFLRGVGEVALEATVTAKGVLTMREAHRELLKHKLGKGAVSALELLDTLYYRPFVTVQSASEIVGLTFAATNKLVSRLVELEILRPTSEKSRNRVFCYRPFLDLFED